MQILQWLFKAAQEEQEAAREKTASDREKKPNNIVLIGHQGRPNKTGTGKSNSRKFKVFTVFCRRDVAKACFYSSIHLRRVGSFNRRQHWKVHSSRMKKEDIVSRGLGIKTQKGAEHSGNKVLPISDSNTTSSSDENAKKEKARKAMSRMKELLRWAAAAKTEKGGKFIGRKVLHFRNRSVALKAVPDDDQLSNESPKISFRWDVESSSTTTSSVAYSAISIASASSRIDQLGSLLDSAPRKGNWITTDSEFVVLEL